MRKLIITGAVAAALFAAPAHATDPDPHYKIRLCEPTGACGVVCETGVVCVTEEPGGHDFVPHWCLVVTPPGYEATFCGPDGPPPI